MAEIREHVNEQADSEESVCSARPQFMDHDEIGGLGRMSLVRTVAYLFFSILLRVHPLFANDLEWRDTGFGREADLTSVGGDRPGFIRHSEASTGVSFTNRVDSAAVLQNRLLEDGSGVAVGDVDGDGLCDLYFCRMSGANVLFRNLGEWKFEIVAGNPAIACPDLFSTGAAFADVDGDSDLDLLVNGMGSGTELFVNDGSGHFAKSADAGLSERFGSRSMALTDVDGDGDLDLYVTNYRADTVKDRPVRLKLRQVDGAWTVPARFRDRFIAEESPGGAVGLLEIGEPDRLYLNDGRGRFTDADEGRAVWFDQDDRPLTRSPRDWGLAAQFHDLNNDGHPDLYVCNDFFTPDRVWLNRGDGTFKAMDSFAMRKTPWASMAVDIADVDRDGFWDIYAVEMLSPDHVQRQVQRSLVQMNLLPRWGWGRTPGEGPVTAQAMRNTLSWNRGDHSFAEIGQFSGLDATGWTWGTVFLDVDLDGFEDVLIANGHTHDLANSDAVAAVDRESARSGGSQSARSTLNFPTLDLPNAAFRNLGNRRFEAVGTEWEFNQVGVSNGMALGDLDNDGDLDVVINQMNGPALILENRGPEPRLAVRLKGAWGNSAGIGARIRVLGGPGGPGGLQSQEMICAGRYLSADQAMRVFAVGRGADPARLEVRWRSGRVSVVGKVQGNRIYEIHEPADPEPGRVPADETESKAVPFFVDVSDRIAHRHSETPFDDRIRQPLLNRGLGRLGPGIAWIDLNGDSWDDLVIGGGRGGRMRVMLNDREGGFNGARLPGWHDVLEQDQSGLAAYTPEPGSVMILVGLSNYEAASADSSDSDPAPVRGYRIWPGGLETADIGEPNDSCPGALALGDMDGDGDVDLFVAGRVIGGRYPAAASSRIYRQSRGRFELDAVAGEALREVGLVSGALWSDLDSDGFPELILACEWGPIRVFGVDNRTDSGSGSGSLLEETEAWGLDGETGWWNGVTTGDLDGDGRLDIIATNWGRNDRFERYRDGESRTTGQRVYYGDLDGNGSHEAIEVYRAPELGGKWVPWADRDRLGNALPGLRLADDSYLSYARRSLSELLGSAIDGLRRHEAVRFDSMVYWNAGRGNPMTGQPLPDPVQWSPGFGVNVADLDGDGAEDVFINQNFFDVDVEQSRFDAGRGLWLKGDGRGGLTAIEGHRSGVIVHGEGRASAVCDFDRDGRMDLVVTQNDGATLLYRNVRAEPGLRVRLRGPIGNQTGLGAQVRVRYRDTTLGPVREIHGGSGYWSQDSAVPVLGLTKEPVAVLTLWPGGQTTETAVTPGARELSIQHPR